MKHLPPSVATAKGQAKQIRKNIKSTKTQGTHPNEDKKMETLETRSNHVFAKIITLRKLIANDLTVRSPVTSKRGNKYLFILYENNSNIILVFPMKNSTDKEFIRFFQDMHGHQTAMILKPDYIQLDNEAYSEFQALLKENCIDYQLAPTGIQRGNAEERAIITFNDNFIEGLYVTEPDSPMQNWDRLLEQA